MDKRQGKRKVERALQSVKNNAKKDMMRYLSDLNYQPTDNELRAWQNGYIAGINRGSGQAVEDK